MNALKDWWQQASTRDQLMLVGCGIFVGVYILFMGVLGPIKNMRDAEMQKVTAQRASLERVKELAAQVTELNASQAGTAQRSPVENIIQRSVASNGLQISSMNSSGKEGVRLRFDEAPFDKTLKWLHEIEVENGLIVRDFSISPSRNPGMVSVNARIQEG